MGDFSASFSKAWLRSGDAHAESNIQPAQATRNVDVRFESARFIRDREACARHRHPRGSRRGGVLRRASKLDNIVTIARLVETLDEYGIPREAWTPIRTAKAPIIQASAEDFLRSAGVAAESIVIFRVWFIEGVTPAMDTSQRAEVRRKEIKAIGRRRGLEIRATSRRTDHDRPQTRA